VGNLLLLSSSDTSSTQQGTPARAFTMNRIKPDDLTQWDVYYWDGPKGRDRRRVKTRALGGVSTEAALSTELHTSYMRSLACRGMLSLHASC
jgi:hypothetical protein